MKKITLLLFLTISSFSFGQNCSTLSPLDCSDLAVSLPYNLDFNSSTSNTIIDSSGLGTGFTSIMEKSGNASGYEPSLLNISGGSLQMQSQAGIAYLSNNNQVNTLGVGLEEITSPSITIKTTLLNITTGTGSAQSGIWFGFNQDNFVKFCVVNNHNLELRVESGGISTTVNQSFLTASVYGKDILLELIINKNVSTIEAYYTILDEANDRTFVGSKELPQNYLVGRQINSSYLSFAGIYTTHRSGSQFTTSFDSFSIEGETITAPSNPSTGGNSTTSLWTQETNNNISYTSNDSKVIIKGTGTNNFNGASLILAADGVNTGNKHSATWFINHRSTTGTATFEMQRRDVNGNHQGNLLKYRDGEGWLFNTAASKTGNVTNAMSINETGSIGIGTENVPTNYKLAVNGRIISEELKVQLKTNWPDYVFKNDYKLPTLKDVAKHIKEKGHLKDVPSAKEVKENGILLGEMNAKLLQKIEELTLYTIEQEEKLKKMNNLENRILKLEALLNK